MENQNQELYSKYQISNEKSYNFLMHGVEILNNLLNRNYEAYIIGPAVRNLFLNQPNNQLEIVTNAFNNEIKKIYPSVIIDSNHNYYLTDSNGKIFFSTFDQVEQKLTNKNAIKYYNKKLASILQKKVFTIDSLAITPTMNISNIYGGVEDLEQMVIKTIDKPKGLFISKPKAILDALELVSYYGLSLHKKTLAAMVKASSRLDDINEMEFITQLRLILKGKNAKDVVNIINHNQLFKYVRTYSVYIHKIAKYFNQLSYCELISILYLFIGKIPDAAIIEADELRALTENITITQLIASNQVTPMMIYNIGINRLLSANQMAILYKYNYVSQEKLIKKLEKKAVIANIYELNFTRLELKKLLPDIPELKIEIIMNMLLEKVINGEIINHDKVLKEEAIKINNELKAIFEYTPPVLSIDYTEDVINELLTKYHQEYEFLVKVYLNDEKELYNLSSLEREEVIKNAKEHAKTFLLETSQYKILVERGLIND